MDEVGTERGDTMEAEAVTDGVIAQTAGSYGHFMTMRTRFVGATTEADFGWLTGFRKHR